MDKNLEDEDREGAAKVTASGSTMQSGRTQVDIRALKRSVVSRFGSHSLIGKVMLMEPDTVPLTEIVGKVGTWLAVLREDLEGLS